MFSAEASLDPASRSALPGSEEARKMTVTSGLKCLELYQNSGPLGSLVRMLLGSSIWRSTRCTLTWKTKVTPSKRLLFRLVPSTPRTGGTDARLSGVERWRQNGRGRRAVPLENSNCVRFREPGILSQQPGRTELEWDGKDVAHAESAECERKRRKAWKRRPEPGCCCDDVSDTDNGCRTLRRDGELPAVEESGGAWANHGGGAPEHGGGERRAAQPGLGGVDDGLSAWMDRGMSTPGYWMQEPDIPRITTKREHRKDRLQCLGNAVVPQQFYPIFQAIADIERGIVHG